MVFYFLRHGETDWNRFNWITGTSDRPLTDTGRQQAQHVAEYLKKKSLSIQTILTSSLSRAIETGIILNQQLHCPLHSLSEFCELGFGELEGTPYLSDAQQKEFEKGVRLAPHAETIEEVDARVTQGFQRLKTYPLPLLVSHGGVFKSLMRILNTNRIHSIHNCDLYCFELKNHEWSLQKQFP